MKLLITLAIAGVLTAPVSFSYAGAKETVKEGVEDTTKAVKKGAHRVDEKLCEMVDGKMKCVTKKVKNRVDEVKDDVKDIVN